LVATIRLPTGEVIRREIEDHGTAVAVLPYDPLRKVAILVRQFRAPVFMIDGRDHTRECIAGILVEPDATVCARRESLEEAGIALLSLESVSIAWTMPGISTERMHLFLATYSGAPRKTEDLGVAGEHEHISVEESDLRQLAAMADAGHIADMKTLLLVQTLRLRHPSLFG
jgi:nudix-type nucleoside diphosphatase (YffH/AdpP family)